MTAWLGAGRDAPPWLAGIATAAALFGTARLRGRRAPRRAAHAVSASSGCRGATCVEVAAALDGWARRLRAGELLLAVLDGGDLTAGWLGDDVAVGRHAVQLCLQVGGGNPALLEHAAGALRVRQAIRDDAHAVSSQARLSARIMSVLPAVIAAWMLLDDRGRRAMLSPPGLACVVLGVALNLVGWWWMRHLIRAAGA